MWAGARADRGRSCAAHDVRFRPIADIRHMAAVGHAVTLPSVGATAWLVGDGPGFVRFETTWSGRQMV